MLEGNTEKIVELWGRVFILKPILRRCSNEKIQND